MLLAAKHSHAEVCSTLLDFGSQINTSDNSGRYTKQKNNKKRPQQSRHTIRHREKITNKLLLIVGYLIDVEVVISMLCCLCCRTALMLATESNAVSVVEVLVQRGADLSAVDAEGHEVLHYAKVSGSSETKTALSAALNKHQVSGKSCA